MRVLEDQESRSDMLEQAELLYFHAYSEWIATAHLQARYRLASCAHDAVGRDGHQEGCLPKVVTACSGN